MKAKHIQNTQKVQSHRPDLILLATAVFLVLFGLLIIYNASPVTSERDFGDPTRLARLQIIWAIASAGVAFVVYLFPYRLWEKLAPIIVFGSLALLLVVFIPGIGLNIYGAQRWIGIGQLFSIQPSEFAKLGYIIYLSAFLSKKVKFWPFVILTGFLLGILIFQKDLGTAIVISLTGLLLYFLSGAPIAHFFLLVPSGLLSIVLFIF